VYRQHDIQHLVQIISQQASICVGALHMSGTKSVSANLNLIVLSADLSAAAFPSCAAVMVPSLQLGAATMAGSAPGTTSRKDRVVCLCGQQ